VRIVGRAAWGLLVIVAAACRSPEERARETLTKMSVPLTAEAFVARAASGDERAVDAFVAAGMDLNATDAAGHFDVVTRLAEAGADPNKVSPRAPTDTPLMFALAAERSEVARLLIEKGAHSWVQDDKWSPLMMAAFAGDAEAVHAMLARDANVTTPNARGMTAVMFAASRGRRGIVEALVDKGADANAKDVYGYTALMFAANNGHEDTVRALLDLGADATAASESGETAFSYARLNGFNDIASILQPVGVAAP
jgi:ankyrin repeat protein